MNNKYKLLAVLFYGSLWGIAEAVLGYLLHLLPFSVSGFVMFPIGFFFMYGAYKKTQQLKCIFFTGLTAAAIKLIGLALPFLPPYKIFIPGASIILESLAVVLAYSIFAAMRSRVFTELSKSSKVFWVQYLPGLIFASLSWRMMFVLMQFILTHFQIPSDLIAAGLQSVLYYVFLEGMANASLLIVVAIFVLKARLGTLRTSRIKPAAAAGAFIAAVVTTVFFFVI